MMVMPSTLRGAGVLGASSTGVALGAGSGSLATSGAGLVGSVALGAGSGSLATSGAGLVGGVALGGAAWYARRRWVK